MTKIYEFLAADASRWTQDMPAANKEGKRVRYWGPDATCFCLGALLAKFYYVGWHVMNLIHLASLPEAKRLADAVREKFPRRCGPVPECHITVIAHFNDNFETTYEDVLAVCQQSQV